jgi:RecA/RadA recombinase
MANLKIINMQDVETESVSWLWQPYIPAGKITIVQGDPGDGKTTMMLAVAADLTKGRELPGGGDCETSNVIFQTAEDGLADTIKPRLEQLGADCSRIHVIDEDEKVLTFSDERIEHAIVKTGAKLLILDPLQAYLGGNNMNSAGGIRPFMKLLAGIAERTGCAIVIIGHLNKSKNQSQYRGLGSIDIYAAARSVLTVGKIDKHTRAVVQIKSNLAPPGSAIAFELDSVHGFKWLGECDISVDDIMNSKVKNQESRLDDAKRFLKSILFDGLEVAATIVIEAAKEAGIADKTLKRAKLELGVISVKHANVWYWQLPIEAHFTATQDDQGSQDGQGCNMTTLTTLECKDGV